MWYEGLHVNDSNFFNLAKRFTSLISELTGNKDIAVYMVENHPAPASVDLQSSIVNVDSMFFRGTHEIYGDLTYKKRLEFCAGVMVHEGAHVAFTPVNAFDIMLPVGKIVRNDFSFTVANIVEDVFIESYAKLVNPNFAGILDGASDLLFNDKEIKERRSKWNGLKPTSEKDVENALNYMICWKRRNFTFFHLTEFESMLYGKLMLANEQASIEERGKITREIVENLLLPTEEGKGKEGDFSKKYLGVDNKVVEIYTSRERTEIDSNFATTLSENGQGEDYVSIDINPKSSDLLGIDEVAFSGFERIVESRNAQRVINGDPKSSGKKIRNIQHFNDGKIFGELFVDGGRVGRGKQEFVILLDLSGSMKGVIFDNKNDSPKKLKISFAIENVAGLARALEKEGFDYAIIGHSENALPLDIRYFLPATFGKVILYKIKSIGDNKKYKKVKDALSWTLRNFSGGGNNDSCAILLASEGFSSSQNEKILIVVSDGEPVERNRLMLQRFGIKGGSSSIEDTKMVVEALRNKGIKVFSLAIDDLAVGPCEKIYGKNFTRSAFTPKEFVQAIIKFTE